MEARHTPCQHTASAVNLLRAFILYYCVPWNHVHLLYVQASKLASYFSNACHSCSGLAMRLQHTARAAKIKEGGAHEVGPPTKTHYRLCISSGAPAHKLVTVYSLIGGAQHFLVECGCHRCLLVEEERGPCQFCAAAFLEPVAALRIACEAVVDLCRPYLEIAAHGTRKGCRYLHCAGHASDYFLEHAVFWTNLQAPPVIWAAAAGQQAGTCTT